MPTDQTSSATRAGSGPRLTRGKLSCLRCQRRKIRCDGDLPTCKNCRNAGAICQDGVSERIAGLKLRIEWLESIIRQRCPDVDLDTRRPQHDMNPAALQVSTVEPETIMPTATDFPPIISKPQQSTQPPGPLGQVLGGNSASAHEIAMLSLGASDSRYIGPSSGYFLARVMLSKSRDPINDADTAENTTDVLGELIESVTGPLPLPPKRAALRMCDAYFEYIHPQYPILHRQSTLEAVDHVYQNESVAPVVSFQVFMVLAMGATVLSMRSKARLPSDSYCLAALQVFPQINVENSIQGLQCLLLLLIFALHSPSTRFNVWYLNYQCLAGVLDLGLQRNITVESGISLLEQEMRTRIFWVCLLLDRTICTIMGRPIGLRDEACELRLPQEIDDALLVPNQALQIPSTRKPLDISYSIHLFRATKINSEIKYVANSIVQEAPRYAYPPQTDIHGWQSNVLRQLDEWLLEIPSDIQHPNEFMHLICQLRYHGLCLLLLRPSPAIPKPTSAALLRCSKSATASIQILDKMYWQDMLIHNWISLHGLALAVLTLLYCVKAEPEVARATQADALMGTLTSALGILSATGEHWPAAKRCRDILEDPARSMVQWLQNQSAPAAVDGRRRSSRAQVQTTSEQENLASDVLSLPDAELSLLQPFDGFLFDSASVNIDDMMQELFQDFIPGV
ncbi:C6 transcription factor, putative [Cordyceps militaris CM01]|uniref:C6 transcription factor, putative n=1 Tax=Cordyceps militaris (strain CM01) TaxID=983644 RepID=G3JHG3_CORMM|nr:C6 transcription factor, putative [Cordyceps militaris CM01]EGX91719.1 C6 transcription factor, putative [Cordyceps militaris CM01]